MISLDWLTLQKKSKEKSPVMGRYFGLVVFMYMVFGSLGSRDTRYRRTVSYEGEILVRCPIYLPSVHEFLNDDHIDVWRITADGEADIRVSQDLFMSPAYAKVRPECTKIGDVEAIVQRAENMTFTGVKADWFEEYHTYDEIVAWYKNLAANNPETVIFDDSIGKSYEGRDQPAVHITRGAANAEKKIYFQCQIHAREWISGATCSYIADYLVENADKDERVENLLKEVEFVFIPFVNPDGYEYTWTRDRLWRKNRRPGSLCDGVDLNRNYNDHWGGGGSSDNECSETYCGASAASEPETQNTANYFKSLGNIVGAIDWHSYSQLILRPYGWTDRDCPDETRLKALGDNMKEKIKEVHGKDYTSQKSIGLYITTGTASDWFYSDDANTNNDYRAAGYTIELRDTGRYGFELPPTEIIPQGEEMIPAVLEFAEDLVADPLRK